MSDPWQSHFSFYNESFTKLVEGEFMTRSHAPELRFNESCLFCAGSHMNMHTADSVHIPSVGFRLFCLSTTSGGDVGGEKTQ